MDEISKLTAKLIGCRTVSGNKSELERCLRIIEREFSPYLIRRRAPTPAGPVLVFSTDKSKFFDLIIACHIDVVPAAPSEFRARVRRGRIYGRGSLDMKGPTAAALYAVRDWRRTAPGKRSAAVIVSCDEETGGDSIHYFLAHSGYRARFALVPDDGGEREIVVREKGRLQLKLAISGRSAHASVPHEGENPIERLVALYQWLHQKFPLPQHAQDWCTSVVLTKIMAGEAVNQIPDCAEAYFDVRYVRRADRDRILDAIRRYLGRPGHCQILSENNLFVVSERNSYVRKLAQSIHSVTGRKPSFVSAAGTSDAHAFSSQGIPAALIYPRGGGIHQRGEWVSLASLGRFYQTIKNFLENF